MQISIIRHDTNERLTVDVDAEPKHWAETIAKALAQPDGWRTIGDKISRVTNRECIVDAKWAARPTIGNYHEPPGKQAKQRADALEGIVRHCVARKIECWRSADGRHTIFRLPIDKHSATEALDVVSELPSTADTMPHTGDFVYIDAMGRLHTCTEGWQGSEFVKLFADSPGGAIMVEGDPSIVLRGTVGQTQQVNLTRKA